MRAMRIESRLHGFVEVAKGLWMVEVLVILLLAGIVMCFQVHLRSVVSSSSLEHPGCKCTAIERMQIIKGEIIPRPDSKSPLTFFGVPFWGLEAFEAKFVKLSIVDRAQSLWW